MDNLFYLPAYIFFPKDEEEKEVVLKILAEISDIYKNPSIITRNFTSVTFHNDTITLMPHPLEYIKRKNKSYHFIKLTFQEFKQHCLIYSMTIGKSI